MIFPAPHHVAAASGANAPDLAEPAARARLRELGSRVTQPRVRVLAALMRDDAPLSHQGVCDALTASAGIDRVTIYRVLDWLAASGIVHKTAGADRVFRFSLAERAAAHQTHSHFHCTRCGRDFCLEAAAPPALPAPTLPAGFAADHAELTIKGCCASCANRLHAGTSSCPN